MGVSCPNETKCLSKILSNGATLRRNFYAEFEPTFSAQGKFRYCYKGTIKNLDGDAITNYDFPSGKCVVKVYKDVHHKPHHKHHDKVVCYSCNDGSDIATKIIGTGLCLAMIAAINS